MAAAAANTRSAVCCSSAGGSVVSCQPATELASSPASWLSTEMSRTLTVTWRVLRHGCAYLDSCCSSLRAARVYCGARQQNHLGFTTPPRGTRRGVSSLLYFIIFSLNSWILVALPDQSEPGGVYLTPPPSFWRVTTRFLTMGPSLTSREGYGGME